MARIGKILAIRGASNRTVAGITSSHSRSFRFGIGRLYSSREKMEILLW
jgi:hypothetical protein